MAEKQQGQQLQNSPYPVQQRVAAYSTQPYPTQQGYPTQQYYYQSTQQAFVQPGPPPAYSAAPPPPYSQQQPPPPANYQQPLMQQQQIIYRHQGPLVAQFDAGARFDGASQPRVPPPPPGCLPTPAQAAAMQGQTVHANQRRTDIWGGDMGGGVSFGF